MTSRFRLGDRVMVEGIVAKVHEGDKYPWLIRLGEDDDTWCMDGPHVTHAPAHDCGLLPEQLEAVTKERDDAREQLARVCAQVETLGAERDGLRDMFKAERDAGIRIGKRCSEMEDAYATACAGERSSDAEVARLACLLNKRTSDTRILDCMQTLLAMRETP